MSDAQRSWLASFGLAYLASCGIVYANFISVLVHGLQLSLDFSPQLAGGVASSNLLGGAVGALIVAVGPKGLAAKRTAFVAIVLITLLDIASIWVRSPEELILLRGIHGVAAGLLIGFVYRLIAVAGAPERALGLSLVIQITESAVSLNVFPPLLPLYGMTPVFLAMALLEAIGLLIVISVRTSPPSIDQTEPTARKKGGLLSGAAILSCMALLFYQCSRFMGAGFAFEFGDYLELSKPFVALTLSAAGWFGGAGAAVAAVIGTRFGRKRVLLLAVAVQVLASLALLGCHDRPWLYATLIAAEGFFGIFAIPYFFGVCMAIDPDGRLAVMSSFISKVGLAIGPVLGGALLAAGGFPLQVGSAIVVGALSGLFVIHPLRQTEGLNRRRSEVSSVSTDVAE